jgi:hypothetical protein
MEVRIEYKKLRNAIERSPDVAKDEINKFLVRAQSVLKQKINQSPWSMGRSGGGAPVASGNLKRSHKYDLKPFSLEISIDEQRAEYAKYVHGIAGFTRKRTYQLRPWLRYAEDKSSKEINNFGKTMLDNLVSDLAR